VLRGFGGTKTFREFMRGLRPTDIPYRFVATATPSPNQYIEIALLRAFLGIMDVGEAKTRFFKRDSRRPISSRSILTRKKSSGSG
jgi:hypothetical protein